MWLSSAKGGQGPSKLLLARHRLAEGIAGGAVVLSQHYLAEFVKIGLEVRDPETQACRDGSVVEQLFCKQQVPGSNPGLGSSQASFSGINVPLVGPNPTDGSALGWRSSQSHLAVDQTPARATGVQISPPAPTSNVAGQPRWLSSAKGGQGPSKLLLSSRNCLDSSVAERFLGKKEVVSPILTQGSKGGSTCPTEALAQEDSHSLLSSKLDLLLSFLQ